MPGRWLSRFTWLIAALTLLLILAGGLVTSTGAALAVPDWPTSYGYFMYSFPREMRVGGAAIEHTHREIGSVVGLLTIALTVGVWAKIQHSGIRWLTLIALLTVCLQGVIGGMRVVLVNHWPALAEALPIVHAALAQAFFALIVSLAVLLSPRPVPCRSSPALRGVAGATVALVYLQILLGAFTRHHVLGVMPHLLGGFVVMGIACWAFSETLSKHNDQPSLLRPALLLFVSVLAQLFLGFAALFARLSREVDAPATAAQAWLPTAHVTLGALVFAAATVLALRAFRAAPLPAVAERTA